MFKKVSDAFPILVSTALVAIFGFGWNTNSTIVGMANDYKHLNDTVLEIKTKLDTQSDTKVNKSDFDAYKQQIYERMRTIEEGHKANVQAIADLTRVQTELTRDVSEINLRRKGLRALFLLEQRKCNSATISRLKN